MKFYSHVDVSAQLEVLRQVHAILAKRTANECNFLVPPAIIAEGMEEDEIRVIYRHYATLYFVFIVDTQESELGILDLIQVFVESLDRCFENVCELDLVFGWQALETVLEEIVQGGMVVETSISKIVAAVDEANRGGSSSFSDGDGKIAKAFSSASMAFQAITRDSRSFWPR